MYNINFGDIINIENCVKSSTRFLKISFTSSDPLYLDENEQEEFYKELFIYETSVGFLNKFNQFILSKGV